MNESADTEEPLSGRDRLLDNVIVHLMEVGISDQSVRQIASAVDSSHRMLLYHFENKAGLISDAIAEIRRREVRAFHERLDSLGGSNAEKALQLFWEHNTSKGMEKYFRLLFEYWGLALRAPSEYGGLLGGIVSSWSEELTVIFADSGLQPERARATARLVVSTLRGLLLDLLTTGEFDEVDAAWAELSTMVLAGLGEVS